MSSEIESRATRVYTIMSFIAGVVIIIQFFFQFIYFTFNPNLCIFGIGWCSLVIGFWFVVTSLATLRRNGGLSATASISKTNSLVTTGFYSITRNPIYIGIGLFSFGLALTTQHILSIFLTIYLIPFLVGLTFVEETLNKTKFGDEYQNYLCCVPRFNLFLVLLHRRKEND